MEITGWSGNAENQNNRKAPNWARRDGTNRVFKTNSEAENVPKVLPKDEDPSLVNRNRRMLGQLLGTLEKFRKEDVKLSGSEAYMRRNDSLKRAEQRACEESERLRQQERETIAEKRRRDLTLRARVAAKAEEKKLELLFLRWSEHHKKLGNFLRLILILAIEQQGGGSSDDFQDSSSKEKVVKNRFITDDALEDRICDLYDLYVDGLDEDAGSQVRKLYSELAALWPNGCIDNHEIKRAICRAKDRRKALYRRKDEEAYTYLLNVLAPEHCSPATLDTKDPAERENLVLEHAEKMDCKRYLAPKDIVEGS